MTHKERLEQREMELLSPFAAKSSQSKGREKPITEDIMRTDFQRDRDRILHCKSFRRLQFKTQVFLSPEGDHYRTRLTHTLEVSQVARSIARGLLLNEDLTEAIALGHDLGHTPFGHIGERTLGRLLNKTFKHSEHSLRVVDKLENNGQGLNLTWETRNGILNHSGGGNPATLEGRAVAFADRIAYINHDIDDSVRAGIIKQYELP
ncbi:MAG: dNTP triphosphohydrolase, partial [Eubacteriales bacterium]|nr:dNTP triphosphohydrolase [Eubacteriales bacterium]